MKLKFEGSKKVTVIPEPGETFTYDELEEWCYAILQEIKMRRLRNE